MLDLGADVAQGMVDDLTGESPALPAPLGSDRGQQDFPSPITLHPLPLAAGPTVRPGLRPRLGARLGPEDRPGGDDRVLPRFPAAPVMAGSPVSA